MDKNSLDELKSTISRKSTSMINSHKIFITWIFQLNMSLWTRCSIILNMKCKKVKLTNTEKWRFYITLNKIVIIATFGYSTENILTYIFYNLKTS